MVFAETRSFNHSKFRVIILLSKTSNFVKSDS